MSETSLSDDSELVVVGASLAGLRAVEGARGNGFKGNITFIGAEDHVPYDRPPLSKAVLEGSVNDTTFRPMAEFADTLGVDLKLGSPAVGLDLDHKRVHLGSGEVEYDRLIVATGSAPRWLAGSELLAGVFVLRTVDDARSLRSAVTPDTRVVIVGGGFIGAEVASSCVKLGAKVTIVEAASVPLVRALGPMGGVLSELHERNGVSLRTGVGVTDLVGDRRVSAVKLSDGEVIDADVLVVGIGSAPSTGWLVESGIALHEDGGIICRSDLRTNDPCVWAAGDVAHWENPTFGTMMRLENWTSAGQQGGHAARNAVSGRADPFCTVPYYWTDWYGHKIQFVGLPKADEVRIISGSVAEGKMLAVYRVGDKVVGALGVRQPRHVLKLRGLIEQHAQWDEALTAVL